MASPEPFHAKLERLRGFSGSPEAFWALYLDLIASAAEASQGVVLTPVGTQGERNWRELARQSAGSGVPAQFPPEVISKLEEAARARGLAEAVAGPPEAKTSVIGLAIRTGSEGPSPLGVLVVETKTGRDAEMRIQRLLLLADYPSLHFATRSATVARADLAKVTGTLDLLNQLNPFREFLPAAMALCNEFASRFKCTQVSLAWLDGRYLKLQAVSNLEKFASKVEAVRDLETVMEEALDQDDEIVWPSAPGSPAIVREHGLYSSRHKVPILASIPLREKGSVVGIVHLHRADTPFSAADLAALRVQCDQAGPWLAVLWRFGRGGVRRWRERVRAALGKLWGVENAWAKLGAAAGALVLLALVVVRIPYRVDSTFILRSANQVLMPAPFDGFIQSVQHESGDAVQKGEVLLDFDETPLRNREASLLADIERYRGEAERAESGGHFAELRIAQAQESESRADLAIARYQISQSSLKAPFAGVVMEGRHREELGASVKQGELLFRVARLDGVYAEIDVDERDIQDVQPQARGQVSFTSRPGEAFPLLVTRIDPGGTVKKGSNVFIVRGDLDKAKDWWRPGMTGVAKINAGWRSLGWIAFHRLVDFLRLKFWWW
ncbi:MAG TPA: efflux RND transporter periplasmic adaptor subunit [Opitutaceae bacterium]|jgi:RND family efflux transporter MFP subunit|nr:efflux RND transporter periplasmic adaptor subunit [Opitutaceae bacterium]